MPEFPTLHFPAPHQLTLLTHEADDVLFWYDCSLCNLFNPHVLRGYVERERQYLANGWFEPSQRRLSISQASEGYWPPVNPHSTPVPFWGN